jgi:hypothetical protein
VIFAVRISSNMFSVLWVMDAFLIIIYVQERCSIMATKNYQNKSGFLYLQREW